MKRITTLLSIAFVLIALLASTTLINAHAYSGIPTFSIQGVVRDQSVTIKTSNFPANDTFTVRMGAYGTLGINGTVVATSNTGSGGVFVETYTIPDGLKGSDRIAVRLESPTSGYYAYNWFYNNTTGTSGTPAPTVTPGGPTATPKPTSTPGPSATPKPTSTPGPSATPKPTVVIVYPSFSIQSVVRDQSVTIKTNNFPANDTFTVRMGAYGTLGINGTVVTTTDSGAGGVFTITYTIPAGLKGLDRIAIRLESPTTGYYAYNWFYNNTYP